MQIYVDVNELFAIKCYTTFLAAGNLNVSALQRSIASIIQYSIGKKKHYSIHYLTGQNQGLSGQKNIWPVIRTSDLLSVILSPGLPVVQVNNRIH